MLAVCSLDSSFLEIESFECLNGPGNRDFSRFEKWLCEKGPWIAGIDFPFGQPEQLIDDLNWPRKWSDYVSLVDQMNKHKYEEILTEYKRYKPFGRKELRRITDITAGSISPMKLYGVPVGKMFFEGAPRLLKSGASIYPVNPVNAENRLIIEAYPKLIASICIGNVPYKSDTKQTGGLIDSRQRIIETICSGNDNRFVKTYGLRIKMSHEVVNACINDKSGDHLDSALCAVQAAWFYCQKEKNYGISGKAIMTEGWICDPNLLE